MKEKWVHAWWSAVAALALSAPLGLAQPASHLRISAPGTPVHSGESVLITVEAIADDGSLDTNWQGQVGLTLFKASPPPPVISEVCDGPVTIEVTNPGNDPIDLSGWELEALGNYPSLSKVRYPPNGRLVIPQGTWLAGKGVMTWSDQGTPPGEFPAFVSPERLNGSGGFYIARLFNSRGDIVDEVYLSASPPAPYAAFWKGPGLGACPSGFSFARIGALNRRRNSDWITNTPTWGRANPGLQLPWTNSGTWLACSPAAVSLTNGAWEGTVVMPEAPVGVAWLVADNGLGVSGWSAPIDLASLAPITLQIPPSVINASEAHAGFAGLVTITVPEAVQSDLAVGITLSETNEFAAPRSVVIAAGTNAVQFPMTNLDDNLPDGDAIVTLTASAPGYAPATATLVNADNESGTIYVVVPVSSPEDAGFGLEDGRVFLSEPAIHDVLVTLSADEPVQVPGSVVIKKGQLSQSFHLQIGGDNLINPTPWGAHIRARTGAWPVGDGVITLEDDDQGRFAVSILSSMLEGSSATGRVQVTTPYQLDTTVFLSSENPRLVVPNQVVLPAGALGVDFILSVANDSSPETGFSARVSARIGDTWEQSEAIVVVEHDPNVTGIAAEWLTGARFAGSEISWSARLVNDFLRTQLTNVSGRVDLIASTNLVQLRPDANPVEFTNGVWNGRLIVDGEALGCQLQLKAAGFEVTSSPFDVLQGFDVPFPVTDAAQNKVSGTMIVLEPDQTNGPARLTELDPMSGLRGRSMDLPRPAKLVRVSDDGQVAWLASNSGTLQRVDLKTWRFDQEFWLGVSSNSPVSDLVILPGGSERVVAVTPPQNTDWQVTLFNSGSPSPNRADVPGLGPEATLLAARPNEVFCLSPGRLSRLVVKPNAVVLDQSVLVSSDSSAVLTLSFIDQNVVIGNGDVIDADTLDFKYGYYPFGRIVGAAVPAQHKMLFVDYGNVLVAVEAGSHESLGTHALPASTTNATRAFVWGTRGLAFISPGVNHLTILQTPLLSTNLPDLVLTASGPTDIVKSNCDDLATFSWEFGITNHGAGAAEGVWLDWAGRYLLGSLAPGEGTSLVLLSNMGWAGILGGQAIVGCATPDANPLDNVTSIVTRVRLPDLPRSPQLILGMTDLVGSPAGDRLYAALSTRAAEPSDGVAVINPATGTIEEKLEVGTDPERLLFSSNGTRLYVLLGTNLITRWNLETRTNELSMRLTNETVLDLVASLDSARAVVVATSGRIAVFDDDQIRPGISARTADQCGLGFAGGKLWVAEPDHLRYFSLDASGLSAPGEVQFPVARDYCRFVSDGRRLFFAGGSFDTQSDQGLNQSFGYPLCVDPTAQTLFAATGSDVRRYSLSTQELEAKETFFQACGGPIQQIARWGSGGLALRSGQELIMAQSALVPSLDAADLAVSIVPPDRALAHESMDWIVVLTNKSDQIAPRSLLTVNWGALGDLHIEGPYSWQANSTLLYDAGDVLPHSSASFKISGWNSGGDFTMTADAQTAARDANLADNSVSVTRNVASPDADIAVTSISAPSSVRAGDEFDITVVVSNAGPDNVGLALLSLSTGEGLQVIGVTGEAFVTNAWGGLSGSLAAGESKSEILRCKAEAPGLLPISVSVSGAVSDLREGNNQDGAVVFAGATNREEVLTRFARPSRTVLTWDRSRQQLLAAFPDYSRQLFVLDPASLKPLETISLTGRAQLIATCNNGRHAWVALSGGTAVRVDLTVATVDLQFDFAPVESTVFLLAAPPGQSNILIAAFTGSDRLTVFDGGVRLPMDYGPLPMAGGPSLVFSPGGRLFVASSQMLRELEITPSGLAEVRDLDRAAVDGGSALSYAAGRLFYSNGRVVNPDTGAVDDTWWNIIPMVGDDETGVAYTANDSYGPQAILNRLDAATLGTQWRLPLASRVDSILPMGTNGCVISGDGLWLLNAAHLDPRGADLSVTLTVPPVPPEIGVQFPLQVAITNRSNWTAQQASLSFDLSPGLVLVSGPDSAGTTNITVNLGGIIVSTNLTFNLVALASGAFPVRAAIKNDLVELNPADNEQEVVVDVPSPAVFLFDNTAVPAGIGTPSNPLVAWLSRPAATTTVVSFTARLLTSRTNDPQTFAGSFQFGPGQTMARATGFAGGLFPELAESFTLSFSSTNANLILQTAVVTVFNDYLPQVSVGGVSLFEGDSGYTNANFHVILSQPAPFPVDVQFQVTPGSAWPDLDYLPRQGWLHFAPYERMKTVSVPIVGDTTVEPDETATFVLLQAINAELGSFEGLLTIKNDDARPAPQIAIRLFPDGLVVDFNSVLGGSYQLQIRTNLTSGNWETQPGSLDGNGGPLSFNIAQPADGMVYYRVSVR